MKMKRYILMISIGMICTNLSFAQEYGKWRAGIEAGMRMALSFLGAIELKYNLQNNMNIGLRVESLYFQNNISDDGRLLSFCMTYDYYFFTRSQYSPFIGAGLGYYFCNAQYFTNDVRYNNPTCLFRTGFEFRNFRTSLAYNIVRTNETIFYVKKNDYISLTIGFFLGGGIRKLDAARQ
jgi:hypothetical protein